MAVYMYIEVSGMRQKELTANKNMTARFRKLRDLGDEYGGGKRGQDVQV